MVPVNKLLSVGQGPSIPLSQKGPIPPDAWVTQHFWSLGSSICSEPAIKFPRKCSISLSQSTVTLVNICSSGDIWGNQEEKVAGTHLRQWQILHQRASVSPQSRDLESNTGFGLLTREETLTSHYSNHYI